MEHFNSYLHIEVEEIVDETDLSYLLCFPDGEWEWVLKSEIVLPDSYKVGDRNISVRLKEE